MRSLRGYVMQELGSLNDSIPTGISPSTQKNTSGLYGRQKRYHANHPWVKFVCWANRRCSSQDSNWKPFYYDKGIKCHITSADTKMAWFRDGAASLHRPSLDRICPQFSYVPWNIRFIEFEENVKLAQSNRRIK